MTAPVPSMMASGGASDLRTDLPVLERSPGYLIRVAQQVHTSLWRNSFGGEVTSVQLGCLLVIVSEPGCDQQSLCRRMSLDKVNAADVVRRMAAAGLIERAPSREDRRRRLLHPTLDGRRRLALWLPTVLGVQQQLLEPLSARRRQVLLSCLRDVIGLEDEAGDVGLDSVTSLYSAPGHLIRRAQQRHFSVWQQQVGPEVTSVQYATLLALTGREPVSQVTIGSLVSLDKSSAADVMVRLHERGLVDRVQDTGYPRQKLISVTSRGRRLVRTLSPAVIEVQERLLEPLADGDRTRFIRLLGQVAFR
jgi:MarR family transcriptional regulator, lower aerobic nicotinate degradation pathway regulator